VLTGLIRYVYAPIAALVLWAVVLAVSPAMANAQATYQTQDQQETKGDAGCCSLGGEERPPREEPPAGEG
jgi:hypothetical protein